MEGFLFIVGLIHFVGSVFAGVLGDTRTCGFLYAWFAWLINPVLGLAVLLCAKDKRDLAK